eukprot:4755623-Pyramimonas_sp.AAC.1
MLSTQWSGSSYSRLVPLTTSIMVSNQSRRLSLIDPMKARLAQSAILNCLESERVKRMTCNSLHQTWLADGAAE